MDQTEKQKTNVVVSFLMAWVYVLWYALRGAKFLLFDIWVAIFNYASWNVDRTYQKVRKTSSHDDNELMYERTKNKEKRQKVYHYSASTLKKYEKMKEALAKDLQMAGATRSKQPNIYQYTVRNIKGDGKIFKDTMGGFSKLDINSFLVNEGYEVYDIQTNKWLNFAYKDSSLLSPKLSVKDLVFWLTQLSTYIKAGMTLSEAVKILTVQMKKNKSQQRVFKALSYELSLGESFSNAMAKQGNFFPALLINMIRAAEASGTLQETLDDMAQYYTDVNNTRKEMKSALTYPTIIFVFAVAVVTFIIIYVVPQFTQIYTDSEIPISGMTALVVNLSHFLTNNLVYIIIGFVFVIILLYVLYKKLKAFRVPCQILFMKIPVLKDVIIYKELTIFSKTFASLLHNNVYITDSMDILSKITNNEIYKAIMYKTINNIIKGEKISEAFKDHWAIPDVAYYMIVTGESTGQLADMMQKVSDYYSQMHKGVVGALKSSIEPVVIVFLALMVGMILLAVIVPMFNYYNSIL